MPDDGDGGERFKAGDTFEGKITPTPTTYFTTHWGKNEIIISMNIVYMESWLCKKTEGRTNLQTTQANPPK